MLNAIAGGTIGDGLLKILLFLSKPLKVTLALYSIITLLIDVTLALIVLIRPGLSVQMNVAVQDERSVDQFHVGSSAGVQVMVQVIVLLEPVPAPFVSPEELSPSVRLVMLETCHSVALAYNADVLPELLFRLTIKQPFSSMSCTDVVSDVFIPVHSTL